MVRGEALTGLYYSPEQVRALPNLQLNLQLIRTKSDHDPQQVNQCVEGFFIEKRHSASKIQPFASYQDNPKVERYVVV